MPCCSKRRSRFGGAKSRDRLPLHFSVIFRRAFAGSAAVAAKAVLKSMPNSLGSQGRSGMGRGGTPEEIFLSFSPSFCRKPIGSLCISVPGAQQLPLGWVTHRAAPACAITLRDIASSPSSVVRRGGHPSLLPFWIPRPSPSQSNQFLQALREARCEPEHLDSLRDLPCRCR